MKYKTEKKSERKTERYTFVAIFLAVLIATNIGAYFLGSSAKDEIASSKFSLLNPARAFIKQKDLIVNFQPLRDYLNDKYEADPNVSVYFEYLPTGASIAINKDAEFYPASLLKVPVAMAVAKKIESGEWKWTNELVLMSTDKDEHFGTLYKEKTGGTYTIEEVVRRSLSDSDNTAHFILIRNLELKEISDVYDHMGLNHFLSTEGKMSAKQYSVLLRSLYSATYISGDNSQKLLSYLTKSSFNDFLQSGLPADVPFAHKIGVADDTVTYLDSGIVYLKNRPYLLTVMVQDKAKQKAQNIMADISKTVYNYVSIYNQNND